MESFHLQYLLCCEPANEVGKHPGPQNGIVNWLRLKGVVEYEKNNLYILLVHNERRLFSVALAGLSDFLATSKAQEVGENVNNKKRICLYSINVHYGIKAKRKWLN